ncbi:MAG: prepilin-type N-terminal cleavage/methylation domain-containing protein [Candidatus Omnitrophota bacterium]
MKGFTPLQRKRQLKGNSGFVTGFTLVEVLVSLFISGFLIAALCIVLNLGNMTYDTDLGLLDLHQQARQAMNVMLREIRQSESADTTLTDSGASIQFRIPMDITAEPVTYSDSINYYLSNGQIIREHPAGITQVLANGMSSLCFCWDDVSGTCQTVCSDVFTIRIDAAKTVKQRPLSFSLTEKVRLRNE